jgi:hypothetical protein
LKAEPKPEKLEAEKTVPETKSVAESETPTDKPVETVHVSVEVLDEDTEPKTEEQEDVNVEVPSSNEVGN